MRSNRAVERRGTFPSTFSDRWLDGRPSWPHPLPRQGRLISSASQSIASKRRRHSSSSASSSFFSPLPGCDHFVFVFISFLITPCGVAKSNLIRFQWTRSINGLRCCQIEFDSLSMDSIEMCNLITNVLWVFYHLENDFLGFHGSYWVLLGLTGFSLVFPGFTGLSRVLLVFYWKLYLLLPSFTGFYWVLLGFTVFYLVLLGFT